MAHDVGRGLAVLAAGKHLHVASCVCGAPDLAPAAALVPNERQVHRGSRMAAIQYDGELYTRLQGRHDKVEDLIVHEESSRVVIGGAKDLILAVGLVLAFRGLLAPVPRVRPKQHIPRLRACHQPLQAHPDIRQSGLLSRVGLVVGQLDEVLFLEAIKTAKYLLPRRDVVDATPKLSAAAGIIAADEQCLLAASHSGWLFVHMFSIVLAGDGLVHIVIHRQLPAFFKCLVGSLLCLLESRQMRLVAALLEKAKHLPSWPILHIHREFAPIRILVLEDHGGSEACAPSTVHETIAVQRRLRHGAIVLPGAPILCAQTQEGEGVALRVLHFLFDLFLGVLKGMWIETTLLAERYHLSRGAVVCVIWVVLPAWVGKLENNAGAHALAPSPCKQSVAGGAGRGDATVLGPGLAIRGQAPQEGHRPRPAKCRF
mmetsp:Transcript_89866/g.253441  ORF Transcript_89866/g.253441 Transcript_89866/m.253441 type:complete len:428 (+) Transcript_89866:244-1527(+)